MANQDDVADSLLANDEWLKTNCFSQNALWLQSINLLYGHVAVCASIVFDVAARGVL